jgi:hypothetical protein
MAEAKREFETARAAEHPQPLSDHAGAGAGLDWMVALYAIDGGLREGIWIADLNGWTLEYRATYHVEDERAALADLEAFTDLARKSAGARLSLCAKSASPDRTGHAIKNRKDITDGAMMASILGGAALAGVSKEGESLERPLIWCVERSVETKGHPMLFWRAIDSDGQDANRDRLSGMTQGPAPVLDLGPDGGAMGAILNSLGGGKERWSATMQVDEQTLIFAFYDGRPPAESVSDLFANILGGRAKAVGGFSADGKKITIVTPSDEK